MKLVLVTLIAALYCVVLVKVSAVSYKEIVHQEWESFKERHGKKYKNEDEERFRLKIFMENSYKIHWHNANAAKHNKSYKLGMNEYGDMLHHEFVHVMNGFKRPKRNVGGPPLHREHRPATFLPPANFQAPRSVDWREHGYVTPVKNQGQCGSCWSFSATGALEGQHFRKTGKLVSLSEQNLVDCSREFGNNGCEGGLMDNAFTYIKANGGIDTEKDYPYEAKDDKCRFNRTTVGADDTGFVDVTEGDENALATAVASVGPVSVAIDASHESFQFYSEGIYDEAECSSTELDHGVLVVGYGETEGYFRKKKYWIVKNSWGESWGDKGYIKMARNHKNLCGIASSASYPLV